MNAIRKVKPTDATTNPSLILKASTLPEYSNLVDEAVAYASSFEGLSKKEKIELALDKLAASFGCEIAKYVPGLVSTEVDARLSFDTENTILRAQRLIRLYEDSGIDKSRVLIKVFSTLTRPAYLIHSYDRLQALTKELKLPKSSRNKGFIAMSPLSSLLFKLLLVQKAIST